MFTYFFQFSVILNSHLISFTIGGSYGSDNIIFITALVFFSCFLHAFYTPDSVVSVVPIIFKYC